MFRCTVAVIIWQAARHQFEYTASSAQLCKCIMKYEIQFHDSSRQTKS